MPSPMPLLDELSRYSFTPEQRERIRSAFAATLGELGLIERDDPLVRLVANTVVDVAAAGASSPQAIRQGALKQLTFFEAEYAATRAVLRDAIAIAEADLGNIQSYDAADGSLAIIVQHGFKDDFLRTFERVALDGGSACARAMRDKSPMFIPDVAHDPDFAPYRTIAQRAGFASVLSMPLVADQAQFVGVLSVHFARAQASNPIRMDVMSDYARHAANALSGISRRPIRAAG